MNALEIIQATVEPRAEQTDPKEIRRVLMAGLHRVFPRGKPEFQGYTFYAVPDTWQIYFDDEDLEVRSSVRTPGYQFFQVITGLTEKLGSTTDVKKYLVRVTALRDAMQVPGCNAASLGAAMHCSHTGVSGLVDLARRGLVTATVEPTNEANSPELEVLRTVCRRHGYQVKRATGPVVRRESDYHGAPEHNYWFGPHNAFMLSWGLKTGHGPNRKDNGLLIRVLPVAGDEAAGIRVTFGIYGGRLQQLEHYLTELLGTKDPLELAMKIEDLAYFHVGDLAQRLNSLFQVRGTVEPQALGLPELSSQLARMVPGFKLDTEDTRRRLPGIKSYTSRLFMGFVCVPASVGTAATRVHGDYLLVSTPGSGPHGAEHLCLVGHKDFKQFLTAFQPVVAALKGLEHRTRNRLALVPSADEVVWECYEHLKPWRLPTTREGLQGVAHGLENQ